MKMITKLIGFYLNVLAKIAPRRAAKLGFTLFCHPFRGKITDRQKKFLQTAEQFTFSYEGETIQAYKWGHGPKNILLLHGWQSHTYRWKSYVELLSKEEYTIYSMDAPGHGLSTGSFLTVPFYSGAVQKMTSRIGKPHTVIGHSLGSFTSLYTFHHHAEITPDRLVSLASPGEAKEFFDFYLAKLGLTKKCMKLIENRFEDLVKQAPTYFSAPRFASSITIPGLIIHDEEDVETAVENSKLIHQSWKNSKLILTKGKGHNLKSSEVIQQVVDFINDHAIEHDQHNSLQKLNSN